MSTFEKELFPKGKVIKAQRDIAATWALAGFASAKASSALGSPWAFYWRRPKHFRLGKCWAARLWPLRSRRNRSALALLGVVKAPKHTYVAVCWKKYLSLCQRYFFHDFPKMCGKVPFAQGKVLFPANRDMRAFWGLSGSEQCQSRAVPSASGRTEPRNQKFPEPKCFGPPPIKTQGGPSADETFAEAKPARAHVAAMSRCALICTFSPGESKTKKVLMSRWLGSSRRGYVALARGSILSPKKSYKKGTRAAATKQHDSSV